MMTIKNILTNSKSLKSNIFNLIIIQLFALFLASCGGGNEKGNKNEVPEEAMNSGTLTVYCENGIYNLMDTLFSMYAQDYEDVKLTRENVSARTAMAQLLSGKARVVVVARDYLKDEDSLMKKFKVERHQRMAIAEDALVFYARTDLQIDTMSDAQLTELFTNKKAKLSEFFTAIKTEPEFVINNQNSSEFANLQKLVAKGKQIVKTFKMFSAPDSVVNYVADNPNTIGIGYMSQIIGAIRKERVKPFGIGFKDSTGKYIAAKRYNQENWIPGIQVNVVQGLYPYIVTYYAYQLEDTKKLPWWFGTFLAREGKAQKYIKEYGIVPAYAKIVLKQED